MLGLLFGKDEIEPDRMNDYQSVARVADALPSDFESVHLMHGLTGHCVQSFVASDSSNPRNVLETNGIRTDRRPVSVWFAQAQQSVST